MKASTTSAKTHIIENETKTEIPPDRGYSHGRTVGRTFNVVDNEKEVLEAHLKKQADMWNSQAYKMRRHTELGGGGVFQNMD